MTGKTSTYRSTWTLVIILLLCFLGFNDLHATHNQSGEITYQQTGSLTIQATITTYTKASSEAADRDSLELFWGDGSSQFVLRSNGSGEVIQGTDVKKNLYIADHTYPGRATYTLSFSDPNRVSGILNVNYPNSVDVPFYLETTFTLLNTQFEGENSSAIMLQAPLDFACVNTRFIHNPNAFDMDGDSLAYELISPLEAEGLNVPQYLFPNQVTAGPDNNISLNPITGDFVWDAPQTPGQYNIAFRINEFRDGILINSIVRDMTIFVDICDYKPPMISVPSEICVIAGELIEFDVNVSDPDVDDLVFLSATGGPFNVETSPAELQVNNGFQSVPFTGKFTWQTTCEHISLYPYQIVFRAQDNSAGDNEGLADLKTIQIRVLGPPPLEVDVEDIDDNFHVSWESPYRCENALDDYFIGFSVWRKENSNNFEIDSCEFGLDGKGYQAVTFLTNQQSNGRYFFVDETAEDGKVYCYRILGEFALKNASGNPFNRVSSIPSEEICRLKNRNYPFLLNVSVEVTSETNGEIYVRWTKPDADDIDTLVNTGPYQYQLQFADIDDDEFLDVGGASFVSNTFGESMDTSFTHLGLNTLDDQYKYQVLFTALGNGFESTSPSSSSVYLSAAPTDERINLSWRSETSWQNYKYEVFRQLTGSASFESIGIVTEDNSYTDRNLENGKTYCYKVISEGDYGLDEITHPLFNDSQESCAVPIDNQPPCKITMTVDSPCVENKDADEVINLLRWNNASIFCTEDDDVALYRVYYGRSPNDLELLVTIEDIDQTSYNHEPTMGIQACYAVTVVDFLGNESELSDIICVENCPSYELPNTFTPNGDSANDLFIPIRNRFISSVQFKLYNRWGNLVYETTDPQINWDGNNLSGEAMDESVYHYTCELFESELQGLEQRTDVLEGFIHLIRGN